MLDSMACSDNINSHFTTELTLYHSLRYSQGGRPPEDNSLVLQKNEGGVVSHVHHDPLEVDFEGYKFIKVCYITIICIG